MSTPLSDNMRGALFMMGSMGGFVFNDAVMKLVSGQLSLFQAVFLRGLIMIVILGALAWRSDALFGGIKGTDRKPVFWRTLGEIGGTVCFLTALFNMPIANVTAILQALPLAVTLAAAFLFGEKVGWRRYTAIAIGFVGMMIIIRPGSDGFSLYSIWAVASLFFIVLRDLATRGVSSDTKSVSVALITSIAITVVSGVVISMGTQLPGWAAWRPLTGEAVALVCLASLFLTVGYVCAVSTMRIGEISFVAPFRYTILLWAILLGYLVFGDVPDIWMLIGASIIVATGIFTFYREQLLARRQPTETGAAQL